MPPPGAAGHRVPAVARVLSLLLASLAAASCSRDGPRPTSAVAAPAGSRAQSTTTATVPPTTTTTPPTTSAQSEVATPGGPVVIDTGATGASWSLLAVGDVLLDDTEAAGVDPFAAVQPSLAGDALTVVNAEMVVAAIGVPATKAYVFRALPSAAATLARAGVDVANLANNHSLDYGVDALMETIRNLRAAGVVPVGAGPDARSASAPAQFLVGGTRVAVVGASRIVPRRDWAAAGDRPGVASAYAEGALLAAVRAARASAEVVVVAVHWGVEGSPCPDRVQERLGAALLGAGATVVLGSHPHVLQPVVSDARGVLAYSLGNFAFHRRRGATGDSAVLEVRFDGARVVGVVVHPHVLDRGPPRPAPPEAAARIVTALANPCLPPPTTVPVPAP